MASLRLHNGSVRERSVPSGGVISVLELTERLTIQCTGASSTCGETLSRRNLGMKKSRHGEIASMDSDSPA